MTRAPQPRSRTWLLPALFGLLALLAGCAGTPEEGPDLERYETLMSKGRAYMKRGNARMALPSLMEARRIKADDVELFALLGVAFDRMGRPVQSLEALEQAQRLQPDNGGIRNNLGVALMRQDRLDEAEKQFQAALADKSFPTPEEIHFNMALLHKRRGRIREMQATLEQALRVNANFQPARLELADHFRDLGQHAAEQEQLRKALMVDEKNLDLMERLALSYLKSGNRAQALPVLKRVLTLAPPGTDTSRRVNRQLATLGNER